MISALSFLIGCAHLSACSTNVAQMAGVGAMSVATASASFSRDNSNLFVPLVRSMADRLDLAEQVALNKWDSKQPVVDVEREKQVIANVAEMAKKYGVAVEDAISVFQDQIAANKVVQVARLNQWKLQDSAPDTPRQSLSRVIRPALDEIQTAILENLRDVESLRKAADCRVMIVHAQEKVARQLSFDELHRTALEQAVSHVCVTVI